MSVTYAGALNAGLHRLLREDARVFVLGEDILDPYGGAFKITKGLSTEFPERVMTTPISEAGIVGVAAGMGLRGLRPIVEIMFGDFITLSADAIVNSLSKYRLMYRGRASAPVVVRTPSGGGRAYGPTHSQSLETLFLGVPNLQIVAPSHLHEPGELLRQCVLQSEDPTLFVEHKLLYPEPLWTEAKAGFERQRRDEGGWPVAVLRNFSSGSADVTVVGYGGMLRPILEVAERLRHEEIRLEIVAPSRLDRAPWEAIAASASATRHVVIVDEGIEGRGWAEMIAAGVYDRGRERLAKPVVRVARRATILPSNRQLEKMVLPSAERIEAAVLEVLA